MAASVRHIFSHLSSGSVSTPQVVRKFDFQVENFCNISLVSGKGQILSPVASVDDSFHWTVEVFPRGRNNVQDGQQCISLVIRNVTDYSPRATCQVMVRVRHTPSIDTSTRTSTSGQEGQENVEYEFLGESPPAYLFEPSGFANDQWILDAALPFEEIAEQTTNSNYLFDGTLHLSLKLTVCGDPVGILHGPSRSELHRRNILDILHCLQKDTASNSLSHDLQQQLRISPAVRPPNVDASKAPPTCADSQRTGIAARPHNISCVGKEGEI